MDASWTARWTLIARRLLVSAFLVVHIGATVVWVLPPCPLGRACFGLARYYMLPLGLWQSWGMFAPDPPQSVAVLEAEVVDARGLRYNFAFPKQADYSVWRAIPRHRHPKFAINLSGPEPEADLNRKFAARHVVRELAVPAAGFPVDVHLILQVRPSPPPGSLPPDPPPPKQPYILGTYQFASVGEVRP